MSDKVLIGVCAYNEEHNIGNLLESLTSEQYLPCDCGILIVCSGCTDRTPEIVTKFQAENARITLVNEGSRSGKANALNRIFSIAKKSTDVVVLVNADAIPGRGSILKLLSTLSTEGAAAVFARPVPSQECRNFSYGIVKVIWRLHHLISLSHQPKMSGELCAIDTSYLEKIPNDVATDEPYIELGIRRKGGRILYVPNATVNIRCPTTTLDLLKQRERIWIGHMQLKNETGFEVSTASIGNIMQTVSSLGLSELLYLCSGVVLELIAYVRARIEIRGGKIPYVWKPIRSTKTR
jgi:biofilm PGA synthesis N-glycosyltransferase PgaC